MAHLLCTMPMHDCPSSPVPPMACTHIAPAASGLSAVTSCTYVIMSKCSHGTPENNRENVTLYFYILVAHFVPFWSLMPSHIPGFPDCAKCRKTHDYTPCACCRVLVFVHKQLCCAVPKHTCPNCTKAKVGSAHTRQTNWTLGVKCAWAR